MYIVKAALDLKSLTHDAWGLEQLEICPQTASTIGHHVSIEFALN